MKESQEDTVEGKQEFNAARKANATREVLSVFLDSYVVTISGRRGMQLALVPRTLPPADRSQDMATFLRLQRERDLRATARPYFHLRSEPLQVTTRLVDDAMIV